MFNLIKVLCGIVHSAALLQLTLRIYAYSEKTFEANPVDYLSLLREIATCFQSFNIIVIVWTKSNSTKNLIEYLIFTMGQKNWEPNGKLAMVN